MLTPPFDALNAKAAELRSNGQSVISLGQAVPNFPPPSILIRTVREALERTDAHVYSEDAGLLPFRRSLCQRLQAAYGIEAEPDDVIITAGGNQAFMLAVTTLLNRGDEVLVPAPYFVNHVMAVHAVGALAIEIPLREDAGFSATWEALEPHVSTRTRAVVLCNPANPTGATISSRDGMKVVEELAKRGILVFIDETYMQFVYDIPHWSAASSRRWRDNVVVIGTFSKSFAIPGWRVGFLLADAEVCRQAIKVQDVLIICAPVISQIGVHAAITHDWNYASRFHPELKKRRDLLWNELKTIPRLQWKPTSGAFFSFVHVNECFDSMRLAHDILARAHVVTIPGSVFGTAGEGYLRLSYGSVSRDDLLEALDRLRSYFNRDEQS